MQTSDPTANQLKLVSAEFRRLCSDALRAESDDEAHYCIRRIVELVGETPVLASMAEATPWSGGDALDALRQAHEELERIKMPGGRREELGFLHNLIVGMAHLSEGQFSQLAAAYGRKTKEREWVGLLMRDTVGRYAACLGLVLTEALLEVTPSGTRNVEIRDARGTSQIIVHQGEGSVRAQQTISQELAAIREAADTLIEALDSNAGDCLDPEVREDLRETVVAVREEIEQSSPRRFLLRSAKERLEQFAAAATVGDFLATYGPTLAALIGQALQRVG